MRLRDRLDPSIREHAVPGAAHLQTRRRMTAGLLSTTETTPDPAARLLRLRDGERQADTHRHHLVDRRRLVRRDHPLARVDD